MAYYCMVLPLLETCLEYAKSDHSLASLLHFIYVCDYLLINLAKPDYCHSCWCVSVCLCVCVSVYLCLRSPISPCNFVLRRPIVTLDMELAGYE